MNPPTPIRVIGVGSPMGDDALAWEAVRRVQECIGKESELRSSIGFYRIEGGQRLLEILDGQGTLILVDASSSGATPGTIQRFAWPNERIEMLRPGSTHDMRPGEALNLAATLGIAPARVVVFAMEAQSMEPLANLNPAI